jgi:hypothetical protein
MNTEKQQLYKDFEKEMWLYLDGTLTQDRREYWDRKIKDYPELKKLIEEYEKIAADYNSILEIKMDEDKFNSMIDQTISKDNNLNKFKSLIQKIFSSDSDFAFGKIAFASLLIVAAITITIISNRPNPMQNLSESINSKVLDWDADFVDAQISKVGDLLRISRDDEYRKYYKYKISPSSFDKNIGLVNKDIESLKKEINNKNL